MSSNPTSGVPESTPEEGCWEGTEAGTEAAVDANEISAITASIVEGTRQWTERPVVDVDINNYGFRSVAEYFQVFFREQKQEPCRQV